VTSQPSRPSQASRMTSSQIVRADGTGLEASVRSLGFRRRHGASLIADVSLIHPAMWQRHSGAAHGCGSRRCRVPWPRHPRLRPLNAVFRRRQARTKSCWARFLRHGYPFGYCGSLVTASTLDSSHNTVYRGARDAARLPGRPPGSTRCRAGATAERHREPPAPATHAADRRTVRSTRRLRRSRYRPTWCP
jgi:hypothetical protein